MLEIWATNGEIVSTVNLSEIFPQSRAVVYGTVECSTGAFVATGSTPTQATMAVASGDPLRTASISPASSETGSAQPDSDPPHRRFLRRGRVLAGAVVGLVATLAAVLLGRYRPPDSPSTPLRRLRACRRPIGTKPLFEVIGGTTPAGGPAAATFYALAPAALVAPEA